MVHPPPKRRKIEIVGGSVWGEKEVAIEPAKELFLYQDNKVVAKRMRQAKIQPHKECDLIKSCSLGHPG